jgi:MORN repeat
MTYNSDRTVSYSGQWGLGLRDGYGTMRYASGSSYEGFWKEDRKCGQGVMIWKDVDEVYTGVQ